MATRVKQHVGSAQLMVLTALGIVYGDIGTSPLYAFRVAFNEPHGITLSTENIFSVLSLMFWTLIITISIKYLNVVLRADNKGEGGVLALTALAVLQKGTKMPFKRAFLYLGLFGASLVVGDVVITPAISVLSAVEGIGIATPALSNFIIPITFAILIGLFSLQFKGTAKIGAYFGPIMLVWFTILAALGIYSIVQTPEILKALSPYYAYLIWANDPTAAFIVMGAVFLVATGGEALYMDMGHLGREPIIKGWFYVALPGLLLNYLGQGAVLLRDSQAVTNPFYLMAPNWALIPLVIMATISTIIASQAVISGIYSLASQCIQLGYSPRMEIVHTSEKEIGQIYMPAINWACLVGTIWLVIEFKSSEGLAAAYGLSVSLTMVITTILTAIVAWHTWRWSWIKIAPLFLFFIVIDITFFSANMLKFVEGGYVPIAIAITVFTLLTTWKKGRGILFQRLRARSYPFASLLEDIKISKPARVPGCAVFMVGDSETTPPTLLHNLKHNKVLHQTVIFLTVIGEKIAYVPDVDKVQITKMADGFYRVTGHYGFSESPDVIALLKKCEKLNTEFKFHEPTFFLGREILVAGKSREMSFWRKILFSVMARNAASANQYFKLPLERVIEVGMQVEL